MWKCTEKYVCVYIRECHKLGLKKRFKEVRTLIVDLIVYGQRSNNLIEGDNYISILCKAVIYMHLDNMEIK